MSAVLISPQTIDETINVNDEALQPIAPKDPIKEAIDRYLHRAMEIKFATRVFVPAAGGVLKSRIETAVSNYEDANTLLADADPGRRAHGIKQFDEATRTLQRLQYSDLPRVIESSLFLSLFSAFDVFTGELLRAVHQKKPALFNRLNRSVQLADILSATSLEDIKNSVLDEEIENFRRKSYAEQFDYLEKNFNLELKKFDKWPNFIEAAQRRNLLTHCGGVVSEQYRSTCLAAGYPSNKIANLGEELKLGGDYFLPVCELMLEVGLKLGQTLWRKTLPNDIISADEHLLEVIYDALFIEQWDRARVFAEFAVGQKIVSNDKQRRFSVINLAIALKNLKLSDRVPAVLARYDWSASINEFRLAESILLDRTDEAITIMKRIGKKGDLLSEHSYHAWPLFRTFRETEEFQQAYETIYGYAFIAKLKSTAAETKQASLDRNNATSNDNSLNNESTDSELV